MTRLAVSSFKIPWQCSAGDDAARLCVGRQGSTPRLWGAVGDHEPGGSPVAQRAWGAGALTLASFCQLVVGGRLKLAGVPIQIHEGPLPGNRCQRHAGRPSMSGPVLCLCREKSRWPDAGRGGGPIQRGLTDADACSVSLRLADNHHHSTVCLPDQPARLFHQSRGPMLHVKPVSFRCCAFHAEKLAWGTPNGEQAAGQ
jgi:hypothetical protein